MNRLAFSRWSAGRRCPLARRILTVVAFLTCNLPMLARQWKGSAGMIKICSRFPGGHVVTAETVGAEPVLMRFLVAHRAFAPQAEEGPVEIGQLDLGTGCGCDPGRHMALFAWLRAMLAFQSETSLGTVIEILPVQRDEFEFRAAVFAMAARAICLAG